jgi:hypothetical protein
VGFRSEQLNLYLKIVIQSELSLVRTSKQMQFSGDMKFDGNIKFKGDAELDGNTEFNQSINLSLL